MHLLRRSLILLFSLLLISALAISFRRASRDSLSDWSMAGLIPSSQVAPLVTHIVLFKFKPGTNPTDIKKISAQMLGLKKACKHPVSGDTYIKYISGGLDNSIEGLQNGITHAFILQFANTEDRDYYVKTDPAHAAFKAEAKPVLEMAQVVDFTDGVFFPVEKSQKDGN